MLLIVFGRENRQICKIPFVNSELQKPMGLINKHTAGFPFIKILLYNQFRAVNPRPHKPHCLLL